MISVWRRLGWTHVRGRGLSVVAVVGVIRGDVRLNVCVSCILEKRAELACARPPEVAGRARVRLLLTCVGRAGWGGVSGWATSVGRRRRRVAVGLVVCGLLWWFFFALGVAGGGASWGGRATSVVCVCSRGGRRRC